MRIIRLAIKTHEEWRHYLKRWARHARGVFVKHCLVPLYERVLICHRRFMTRDVLCEDQEPLGLQLVRDVMMFRDAAWWKQRRVAMHLNVWRHGVPGRLRIRVEAVYEATYGPEWRLGWWCVGSNMPALEQDFVDRALEWNGGKPYAGRKIKRQVALNVE